MEGDNIEIVLSQPIETFTFNPIIKLEYNNKIVYALSVSNGSMAFGYTKLSSILKKFINYQNKIVSVGSGFGYLEKLLEFELNFKFILIDHNPFESICKPYPDITENYLLKNPDFIKFYRKPNYKDIKELKSFNQNIIGNCDLMLIWPEPGISLYDMDAITTLKPNSIFILYGDAYPNEGCAGGVLLHYFISCILGRNNDALIKRNSYLLAFKEKLDLFAPKYKVVHQCECILENGVQSITMKTLWINLLPYRPISYIDNTIVEQTKPYYDYKLNKNYSISWDL